MTSSLFDRAAVSVSRAPKKVVGKRGVKPANNFGHFTPTPAKPKLPRQDLLAPWPATETAVPFDDDLRMKCKWPLWAGVPVSALPNDGLLVCGATVCWTTGRAGERAPHQYCAHHRSIATRRLPVLQVTP